MYPFSRNSTNKNLPKSVEIVKKVKYLKALDTKFRPKTRARIARPRICRHIMAAQCEIELKNLYHLASVPRRQRYNESHLAFRNLEMAIIGEQRRCLIKGNAIHLRNVVFLKTIPYSVRNSGTVFSHPYEIPGTYEFPGGRRFIVFTVHEFMGESLRRGRGDCSY